MSLIRDIEQILRTNGLAIAAHIQEELKQQGHVNTGKLFNSVKHSTHVSGADVSMDISMLDYHVFVEHGVRANRIPFGGQRTGKRTSKYIEGLISYFKTKGLSDKEARGAAFATAHIHKREGMPTKASLKYSSNNRRLAFIKESTQASAEIDLIYNLIQDELEQEGNKILDRFEKNIR